MKTLLTRSWTDEILFCLSSENVVRTAVA